jgi:hypothetical protein
MQSIIAKYGFMTEIFSSRGHGGVPNESTRFVPEIDFSKNKFEKTTKIEPFV